MPSTSKSDYYDILGVGREASDKEIKSAYRKLARRYHPDVNPGDAAAEAKFKEISEAFAVLSDSEQRARYDRGGHEAFGPGFDPFAGVDFRSAGVDFQSGSINFADVLGDLFGGFSGRSRGSAARPGNDLRMEYRIGFRDVIRGTTAEIGIPRRVSCGVCHGSGVQTGTGQTACPDCQGSGRRRQSLGGMNVATTCPRCSGRGVLPGAPCHACRGEGTQRREDRVTVRIPAGLDNGSKVRVTGRGDAGRAGGPAGDLYIELVVAPDPRLRREGNDLLCDVAVGFAEAALGGTVEVPTLDGTTKIQVPPGTPSGRKMRLRGQGVPAHGNRPAGDLLAVIQIEPPAQIDDETRTVLERLRR